MRFTSFQEGLIQHIKMCEATCQARGLAATGDGNRNIVFIRCQHRCSQSRRQHNSTTTTYTTTAAVSRDSIQESTQQLSQNLRRFCVNMFNSCLNTVSTAAELVKMYPLSYLVSTYQLFHVPILHLTAVTTAATTAVTTGSSTVLYDSSALTSSKTAAVSCDSTTVSIQQFSEVI